MSPTMRKILAGDQDLPEPQGGSEYNQRPNGNGNDPSDLSPDDCMNFIQLILAKMPPDQQDELIAQLADLTHTVTLTAFTVISPTLLGPSGQVVPFAVAIRTLPVKTQTQGI